MSTPPAIQNVSLIGMPGAGKSTVGVLLAKELKLVFVDTDIEIQARESRSLSAIIAQVGLARFRAMEEAYVAEYSYPRAVIATGGSVVYGSRAMARLEALGPVVFLRAAVGTLAERLGDLDARGVAREADQSLADLLAERTPLYERYADITVGVDGLTAQGVATAVSQALFSLKKQV